MSEVVLVTGAAGFIGSKVSELLLSEGRQVIGIDNMNDYYDRRLKEWRLEPLKANSAFSFIEGDIGDMELIRGIFSENRIDHVINLAARAGVRASVEDPWVYLDTNLKGTLNLLEASRMNGTETFILASTSSLYGFNEMPFSESQRTDSPLAPYGATKKGAEVLCYSYHYLYKLNTIIPRYFTVYGPAGRPDMSIFKFILKIDKGTPIPVYGDGKQTRDFTYIDDIARGTVAMLGLKGYEIINLGNDNSVKLMYVINLIEDALGKKAVIDWQDRHPADVEATWADIEKAKDLLGWRPEVKIEEGIERTVKWYRDNREFILSLREEK
ncbi:MAG: SDR family NAD(P)-dependent oxidoreductase [Nitrospirae bacterium]|nr:MAG: SDR family NAD(P)-dependent oxidoreductase [Nitrospirota bacterium]